MLGTAMWRLRMVVNAIILGAIVALIVAFCSAQATRSPIALVPVLIAGGVFGAVAGLIRPDMIEKYGLWMERSMLGTAMWRLRMVVNAIILGAIVALIVAFCSAQATRSPIALVPVLIAGGVFGAVAGLIRPDMIEKYGLWFV